MILRLAGVLAIAVAAIALLAYLQLLGKGPTAPPAMRHLRAMKDRAAAPTRTDTTSLAGFAALPHGLAVAEYAPIERRGVTLEGYTQRMVRALDGDVHLELAPAPRAPGGPDTVYVTAEITPGWRRGSRRWSYGGLLAALRPNHGGVTAWDEGPARVRVSGWLLYDFQYDWRPSTWTLRYGAPRISGWEIHPVTRIELWDAARGYVDLAR